MKKKIKIVNADLLIKELKQRQEIIPVEDSGEYSYENLCLLNGLQVAISIIQRTKLEVENPVPMINGMLKEFKEAVKLWDDSCWSGSPYDRLNIYEENENE